MMMGNKFKMILISFLGIVYFYFMPVYAFAENNGLDKILMTAKLFEYQSLCEIQNFIEYCPKSIEYEKGGQFKSVYCKSIEEKHGHPYAISITFRNNDIVERKITIPDIGNIQLKGDGGKVISLYSFNSFDIIVIQN